MTRTVERPRAARAAPAAQPAPKRRTRPPYNGPFTRFDPLLLALVAGMALAAALSVSNAGWVAHLEPVPLFALGGVLLGFLLARTRLFASAAHPAAVALGVELLLLAYSQFVAGASIDVRLQGLEVRIAQWIQAVYSGGTSTDTLVFALAMAGLAWLVGYAAAWLVFRMRSPLLAAALSGVGLLINLSYAASDSSRYLLAFLGLTAFLLVVENMAERTTRWRQVRLPVERGLPLRVIVTAGVVGLVVVGLSEFLPAGGTQPVASDAWSRATSPWNTLQSGFDRAFASLNGTQNAEQGLNFGRTLAPRGDFDLSDTPVLRVAAPQPLYLRATTVDRYTGQAMTSDGTAQTTLDAGTAITGGADQWLDRQAMTAQVTVLAAHSSVAFAPSEPLGLSVPSVLETRQNTPQDVAIVRPQQDLLKGQTYSVSVAASTASVQELQQAGQNYPDWVRQEDLQLPRELPQRVRDLTQQVVGTASTPYDKAAAIESFLRSSFTYSTHVAPAPANRDWVDYLLFDSRTGYCDYFATAMTVMLRTQGIPARVASGFAPGELDPTTGTYLVRENHAHSWVEVFFPQYGWITFEPSSIRTIPQRPTTPQQAAAAAQPTTQPAPQPTLTSAEQNELQQIAQSGQQGAGGRLSPLLGALILALEILVGLAAVAVVLTGVLALAWRRGVVSLPRYQQPYAQLVRLASWLGALRPGPSQTPYEVAHSLAGQAPGAGRVIHDLADAYVQGTYGTRAPEADPWPAWWQARRAVARALFRERVRALGRFFFRRPPDR